MSAEWTPDVPKLAAFDEDEWARVERAYAGRLVAYVARRVPDVETRDDVVQEVFLGAVRGIATFDERFTFEQYLFGICRNRTIDQMRRRRFVGTGADADSEDDPGALRIEDLASGDESPSRIVRRTDLEGADESCSRRPWPVGPGHVGCRGVHATHGGRGPLPWRLAEPRHLGAGSASGTRPPSPGSSSAR